MDAKLLLSCIAAERGFPVVLGSRTFIHFEIVSLPRGVYLAKSMRSLSERMFDIFRKLGHEIVAWDEEGLVRMPDAHYWKRRLSPKTSEKLAALLAWGLDDARAFPEIAIVLRPHPLENHEPWKEAARGCENVHVIHEGAVIPWIVAARAVIQNNCTTAVESYLLERPVISYLPITSERLDSPITNAMSHPAHGAEELVALLREILDGKLGPYESTRQREVVEYHIAALDGPLASDRIVDVLEALEASGKRPDARGPVRYAKAWMYAHLRALDKNRRSRIPGDKNNPVYQNQRFPGLSLGEARARVARFGALLGRFEALRINQHSRNSFQIAKR